MAGRSGHLSTTEALAEALGWRVSAIQEAWGQCCVRLYHGGRPVRLLDGRYAIKRYTFVGRDASEAFREADAVLSCGTTATCDTCPSELSLGAVKWTIPPLSSPEDVQMRMSLGQHTGWGPTPAAG